MTAAAPVAQGGDGGEDEPVGRLQRTQQPASRGPGETSAQQAFAHGEQIQVLHLDLVKVRRQ